MFLHIINIGQDTTKVIGDNLKNNLAYLESLQLESTAWVLGLHQVLLFFLVIGRWMLPRGGIRLVLTSSDLEISGLG